MDGPCFKSPPCRGRACPARDFAILPVNGLNPSGHRCRSATSPDGEASPAQKRPPCQRGLAASADWGILPGLALYPVNGPLPPTPRGASGTPPPTALTASLPATRRGGIHPSRAPYAAASSLVKKLTAQILRFLTCKSAPYVVQYKLTKYGKNRRNSKWNTAIRS